MEITIRLSDNTANMLFDLLKTRKSTQTTAAELARELLEESIEVTYLRETYRANK